MIACCAALALAAQASVLAQDRSRDRRESTRDRSDRPREEDRRGRDEGRSRFTRSGEGRRFDNGVTLRRSVPLSDRRLDTYFPSRTHSYPYYRPTRAAGEVVISPFGIYASVFPEFIDRGHVFFRRPSRVLIDIFIPFGKRDDYYLDRRNDDTRWRNDPEVKRSVYDIEDAWRNEDIALLAPLTDPQTRIAIFSRGQYDYSIDANDYLDMTRDFMRSVQTTGFDAYRVNYRSGAYQILAKHTYRDRDGRARTAYLTIALERIADRWTITQIDSSPDRPRI